MVSLRSGRFALNGERAYFISWGGSISSRVSWPFVLEYPHNIYASSRNLLTFITPSVSRVTSNGLCCAIDPDSISSLHCPHKILHPVFGTLIYRDLSLERKCLCLKNTCENYTRSLAGLDAITLLLHSNTYGTLSKRLMLANAIRSLRFHVLYPVIHSIFLRSLRTLLHRPDLTVLRAGRELAVGILFHAVSHTSLLLSSSESSVLDWDVTHRYNYLWLLSLHTISCPFVPHSSKEERGYRWFFILGSSWYCAVSCLLHDALHFARNARCTDLRPSVSFPLVDMFSHRETIDVELGLAYNSADRCCRVGFAPEFATDHELFYGFDSRARRTAHCATSLSHHGTSFSVLDDIFWRRPHILALALHFTAFFFPPCSEPFLIAENSRVYIPQVYRLAFLAIDYVYTPNWAPSSLQGARIFHSRMPFKHLTQLPIIWPWCFSRASCSLFMLLRAMILALFARCYPQEVDTYDNSVWYGAGARSRCRVMSGHFTPVSCAQW